MEKMRPNKPMVDLKIMRIKKGFTQAKLAEVSGVEHALINKYENGKTSPTLKTLRKIAQALDCDVRQLMGEETEKIFSDELLAFAQPLIRLLQEKGHPMMIVVVTAEGADLYEAQCGTEKHPRD